MHTIRRAQDRGHAHLGWLDSWHTFSFSNYYDPRHMGFHSLRVINDDTISPGRGFGMHPHEDMEIITYMLAGELSHRDSLGTGAVLRPGDVQRMSAGTGMVHSEINASTTQPAHLLQIWIEPHTMGVAPRYEDRHFPVGSRTDQLRVIASPDGREGSLAIHQDAVISASILTPGHTLTIPLERARGAYLQLARGQIQLPETTLSAGDALACEGESALVVRAGASGAEFLLFDVA